MELRFHSSFVFLFFAKYQAKKWEKSGRKVGKSLAFYCEKWDLKSGISLWRIIGVEKVDVNQYSFTTFNILLSSSNKINKLFQNFMQLLTTIKKSSPTSANFLLLWNFQKGHLSSINNIRLWIPHMSARLTNSLCNVLLLEFLPLWRKDFNYKGRYCKENPLNENPPPSNQKPPYNAVMLILQLGLGYSLNSHVRSTTLRTNHRNPPRYYWYSVRKVYHIVAFCQ